MRSETIYKKDNSGKVRIWYYEVEGNKYRICSGLESGKITESKWKVCKPKSQATGEDQAVFEAESDMRDKLRIDYHRDRANIHLGPHVFLPQLAFPYKDIKQPLKFPIYGQPKYDGIRSAVHEEGAFSREGGIQPAFPHVLEETKKWRRNRKSFVLDGEHYSHLYKADFNKIVSLVRKTVNITPETIERIKAVMKYYIYDCYLPGMTFENRFQLLRRMFDESQFEYCVLAETVLLHDMDEVDAYYARLLADGYEGMILRDPDGLYETDSRIRTVIKRKEFFDEEFPIKALHEGDGNWSGALKSVTVELPDGQECDAGVSGSYELNAERLREKAEYLDGEATIRFLGWTPEKRLRGGVVKDLHKGKRRD